jgi:hypothetical protein
VQPNRRAQLSEDGAERPEKGQFGNEVNVVKVSSKANLSPETHMPPGNANRLALKGPASAVPAMHLECYE